MSGVQYQMAIDGDWYAFYDEGLDRQQYAQDLLKAHELLTEINEAVVSMGIGGQTFEPSAAIQRYRSVLSSASTARMSQAISKIADGVLTKFETSSLRISQTLEKNSEMKILRKYKSSIEKTGIKYNLPFADQMQVFQNEGVNYLVNGHHRLAVSQKLGINQIKAVIIDAEYLLSRYRVTPEQLIKISDQANSIGNRIRWY